MRRVLILSEAADDLLAAERFYDSREPGVGAYCVDSLLSDIESLAWFHGIHRAHFRCHRILASRFPFGIYYIEAAEATRVVAVLDLRRDPNWLRQELEKRSH